MFQITIIIVKNNYRRF